MKKIMMVLIVFAVVGGATVLPAAVTNRYTEARAQYKALDAAGRSNEATQVLADMATWYPPAQLELAQRYLNSGDTSNALVATSSYLSDPRWTATTNLVLVRYAYSLFLRCQPDMATHLRVLNSLIQSIPVTEGTKVFLGELWSRKTLLEQGATPMLSSPRRPLSAVPVIVVPTVITPTTDIRPELAQALPRAETQLALEGRYGASDSLYGMQAHRIRELAKTDPVAAVEQARQWAADVDKLRRN